jgi:hypothetical protein
MKRRELHVNGGSPEETCFKGRNTNINISCEVLAFSWLLDLLLESEDGESMFLRNISELLPDCKAAHSRRQYCS